MQEVNRQVDIILAGHVRRMQEAPLLCSSREFYPARPALHANITNVSSTKKRVPALSVDDAVKEGTYQAALSVLQNTSIRGASALTGVPESTLRNAIKRAELTGSVRPRKRGRKEGTCLLLSEAAIEGLQDYIDTNPAVTLDWTGLKFHSP